MQPSLVAAGLGALGAALGLPLAAVAQRLLREGGRIGTPARAAAVVSTAALFVLLGVRFAPGIVLVGYLLFAAAAVVLALVDLTELRLPNVVVLPAAIAVALTLVIGALLQGAAGAALGALLGAAGQFAVYLVLALIRRSGIGFGDVKLGLLTGAAAGALGLQGWLAGLAAAVLLNGAAALVALVLRRTSRRGELPFGPWMLAGVVVAIALT